MERKKRIIGIVIMVLIALVSFFGVAKPAASTSFHSKSIESLDDKRATVMELMGASTAASVAISLAPNDIGTPIADKLADLSKYFIIVLCAIFFEKYLLTVTGYAAFSVLIPIACLFGILYFIFSRASFKAVAIKIAVFAITIFIVVPASVKVSNLIEKTYSSSVEETINTAKETEKEIEKETDDAKEKEGKSGISGLLSNAKENLEELKTKMETVLNNMIEALAVMLVTSCIIPIVVLLFFVWFIKLVFNAGFGMPDMIYGTGLQLPNPDK